MNKKLIFKLVAIMCSAFFILLILELTLRLSLQPRTNGFNSGILSKKFSEKNYIINKEGFRNPEKNLLGFSRNKKTVFFIGDSFTFGAGLKEGENFASLVKKKGFNTANYGRSGSDTLDQIKILEKFSKNKKNKIDFLVYQYFFNDIEYLINFEPINLSIFKKTLQRLSNHSYLIDFLYTPFLMKSGVPNYNEIIFKNYDNEELANRHFKDILKINKISKENNMSTIFLIVPFINNHELIKKSSNYEKKLKKVFFENCRSGDAIINLRKLIENRPIKEITVNKFDGHLSKDLHKSISSVIVNIINNKKDNLYQSC